MKAEQLNEINKTDPSPDRKDLSLPRLAGAYDAALSRNSSASAVASSRSAVTSGVCGSRRAATSPTRWLASGSTIGILRIGSSKPNDWARLSGMIDAHLPVRMWENSTIIEFDSSVGLT